jgi:hypothetical protein
LALSRPSGSAATCRWPCPGLLDGASPQTREAVLSVFPPPLLAAFREQWEPKYATLNIWNTAGEPAS